MVESNKTPPCFLQLFRRPVPTPVSQTGKKLLPSTGLAVHTAALPPQLPSITCLDHKCFQLICGRDFIALTIDWVMTKRCSCNWSNSRSPLTMLFNWIVKEAYTCASPIAPKYTCKRVTVVRRQRVTAGVGDTHPVSGTSWNHCCV